MKCFKFLFLILAIFSSCNEKTTSDSFSLQIHEARLLSDFDGKVFSEWDTIRVQRTDNKTDIYIVSDSPLLTEWNFLAFNASSIQEDNTKIVTVRLNAFAEKKMQAFSKKENNLKVPLGLRIGNRWANFSPLLNPVTDRMTLRGLRIKEVEELDDHIKNR